jgi:hypothetical protein
MSEARSLTPLSEADYDAIASAVMETARGRWFMAEFAKRNRQADTVQLLGAIERIERVVGVGATPAVGEPNLHEAAALIADLRLDLERISGRASEPSSGLAARIENAAAAISAATEHVQEVAWSLREAGADDGLCDRLDRRATEIYAATAIVEGTGQQIGKIADTIAMLDSSLRAFCDTAQARPEPAVVPPAPILNLPPAAPLSAYDDIEIVEIDEAPVSVLAEPRSVPARPTAELKLQVSTLLNEDIVFEDIEDSMSAAPVEIEPESQPSLTATSEAGLREIDAMADERKLAYFA